MTHPLTQKTGNTWTRQVDCDGAFVRLPTSFHSQISPDPDALHAAEAGRYHLYVSHACPWAHRTLLVRALKGLTSAISVDVVHPYLTDKGWSFDTAFSGSTGDRVNGHDHLQQVYQQASPGYAGIITVPVLWDKKLGTIVNNESSEIIRLLNNAFQNVCAHPEVDLYPEALRAAIDDTNAWVYADINNGVYRCGFAQSQTAYDHALNALFVALDRVEGILLRQTYLCGAMLTEADVRLFTTLIRFDAVYHTHFKCNRKLISQYPAMHRYLAAIYHLPGVAETVDMDQIRFHYYYSHRNINTTGIVPAGPDVLQQLGA
ncbi:glutathione S-transferase family protein [Rhodoferax sp.]|uniref:glutathione S-transferase family protein n=1 Tax=Rhodoferax sp. TaxID=50421 RepID=UPI0025CBA13B|nr:glutathione S-transferase family protein [Rhodoferax sp.]MCM2342295.1 glutathione S-transferase family protein [Rhodoferax sp.]